MGMACVYAIGTSSLAILSQGTPCKQTRPPSLAPPNRRPGGPAWGGVALLARGLLIVIVGIYLDLRYTGCMYDLASSPGALLGLAIRVSPSLALSAGRRWPRLVDRFGGIVAGRGVPPSFWFFSMFISSLLVRVVVSHRRFFGMWCGAFLLAFRPVVAGWDLQHRRRHGLFHHCQVLPLSGIMSLPQ